MAQINKVIQFGEDVEGYAIPVLNEREIRAAAGIMFLALTASLVLIIFRQDFTLVKYVIVIFLADFVVRVLISPRFSPMLIIGRLIVSRQVPEYVGAPQKKFAWKIGLALASMMFLLLVVLNSYSSITLTACIMCLVFLFFESAFGICLACWVYNMAYKNKTSFCAGDTCKVASKQAIQKTSGVQLLIVAGSIACILLAIVLFNDYFEAAPKSLKEMVSSFASQGSN